MVRLKISNNILVCIYSYCPKTIISMLKKSLLSIMLFAFLLPTYLFAQTGPGGVGSDDGSSSLIIWYRPDNGISTSGSLIDTWSNSAGVAAFDISETGTLRPTLNIATINGYNEIAFNGANRLRTGLTLTTSNFVTNQASSFTVAKANNTSQRSVVYTTDPLVGSTRFSNHIPWNGTVYFDIGACCGTDGRIQVGGLTGLLDYSIWSYDAHPTTGKQLYRNEDLLATVAGSSTYNSHSSQRFNLGGYTTSTNGFSGGITEVVVFKEKVNASQRIIIDNYLSSKFNRSLTSNDFYTQDNPANGDFDHDVAGIGQATDGSSHTDSKGTGIVRINTPSALSNGDFLFWGEESKDPSYGFVTNTSNYSDQLNSKWRVSKVGDLGTVTMSFDISGMSIAAICGDLQLVVDNDSNFSSATSYNLTVSGTTATATGVSFSDADYFTLRYTDQIVWNGTTFFNGSGTSNAPDTTDSCLKLTVKAGSTAVLTADAHIREVEVESGATLQVNDGVLLEVDNGIFNEGVIDLLGEAQLIQNHTGVSLNTGSGDLKIRQQGTFNLYNYNYWSAPVHRSGDWQVGYLETEAGPVGFTGGYDANPLASPIELSSYWLYTFNDLIDNYYGWNHIAPTTAITPAMGYLMKGSGNTTPTPTTDQTYVFRGTANDGNYSISAISGNQVLVGNPYPSAMSAKEFIADNSTIIEGSIYLYEHFQENNTHILADYQGGYATRNNLTGTEAPSLPSTGSASSKGAPEDAVAVGQGFFVKIQNTGTIQFSNSQRVFARESLSESTFYRSAQTTPVDDRIIFWLKFKDHQNNESTIALGYDTNASADYDNGYDSESFNELPNEAYWPIIEKKMCIQGLHSFDISDEIPLGIAITNSGDFTFDIDRTLNFPTNETIYLKDNETNMFYDIKSNPVTLTLNEGEDESRFSIVYQTAKSLSAGDFNTEAAGLYYNADKEALVFTALNNIEAITIYSILGQKIKVLDDVDSKEVDLSFLKTGIYIAEIAQNSGQKLKLKFIKQ